MGSKWKALETTSSLVLITAFVISSVDGLKLNVSGTKGAASEVKAKYVELILAIVGYNYTMRLVKLTIHSRKYYTCM